MPRSKKGQPPKGSKKGFKCETRYCRNMKAKKVDGYYLSHCWRCRSVMLRERHPATYVYNALRGRAKQRRVPWKITLEEFKAWCKKTGYIEKRGHGKGLATIDRINANLGYTLDNIQILEFMENCTKGHYVPGLDYYKQNAQMPEHLKEPLPDSASADYDPKADEDYPF